MSKETLDMCLQTVTLSMAEYVQAYNPDLSKTGVIESLRRLELIRQVQKFTISTEVEYNDDEDWDAVAQDTAYAQVEAQHNLSSRHYKQLYLLAFPRTKFTYAILEAEGQIKTGGSEISDAAYADFAKSTKPGTTTWPKTTMDNMLEAGTSYLRKSYSDMSDPEYPIRTYTVGDLFIAPKWYALPSTEVMGGFFSPDAKKFY
ncbi:hypothetical protein SELMODRAFT_430342 [Selaginella moellendorffii]|uniref:Uncharacterized protein n=1 Tax=Selaginella moellendorffii TaxID=88036 RepID=D8T937_SELML|nr:hypothetical protein SELMODRAFT_430342 [Selaginella moellendorffii]